MPDVAAADPLADVRARHAKDGMFTCRCGLLREQCEVRVLLAALDAERAEREALQAGAVDTLMALGRARERAERAEAAIARARAAAKKIADDLPGHYFDCDLFYSSGRMRARCDCTLNADVAAVVAALETETPA